MHIGLSEARERWAGSSFSLFFSFYYSAVARRPMKKGQGESQESPELFLLRELNSEGLAPETEIFLEEIILQQIFRHSREACPRRY